jgi:hypothetical protein
LDKFYFFGAQNPNQGDVIQVLAPDFKELVIQNHLQAESSSDMVLEREARPGNLSTPFNW